VSSRGPKGKKGHEAVVLKSVLQRGGWNPPVARDQKGHIEPERTKERNISFMKNAKREGTQVKPVSHLQNKRAWYMGKGGDDTRVGTGDEARGFSTTPDLGGRGGQQVNASSKVSTSKKSENRGEGEPLGKSSSRKRASFMRSNVLRMEKEGKHT